MSATARVSNIVPNQWHNLKLQLSGSSIAGFVDGVQTFSAVDTLFAKRHGWPHHRQRPQHPRHRPLWQPPDQSDWSAHPQACHFRLPPNTDLQTLNVSKRT
jgi:hypothetical protein